MPSFEPRTGAQPIAVALLDALAAAGDAAGRARALAALRIDEARLRSGRPALSEAALAEAFRAVPVDRALARRVGRALAVSTPLGWALRYSGLSTLERALRRADRWVARECDGATWSARAIGRGEADLRYARPAGSGPANAVFCGVREGLLEALPSLYGLPLGRVEETLCAAQGAPECAFRVRWAHASRRGAACGLGLGALAGVGLAAGLAPGPASGAILALAVAGLGALAGRSLDLARQLDALVRRRRDEAAWVHDAEGALAEKMDQLAKLDALLAAREQAEAARPLGDGDGTPARRAPTRRQHSDVVAIVGRAVEALRGESGRGVSVELELEAQEAPIHCDAFQIEQMLAQLLRNAARAAEAGQGRVAVRVSPAPGGVEIDVCDDGPGIEDHILDAVFDPFAATPIAGADGGFGLPVSYRIVQAHGGEMRVESQPGQGTRISVFLPGDGAGEASAPRAPGR